MAHTTNDYLNKNGPRLWLIHNSDLSGDVNVRWEQTLTYDWTVDGKALLTGNVGDNLKCGVWDENEKNDDVPAWVVARAVALAVRVHLTRKIVSYVEDL